MIKREYANIKDILVGTLPTWIFCFYDIEQDILSSMNP